MTGGMTALAPCGAKVWLPRCVDKDLGPRKPRQGSSRSGCVGQPSRRVNWATTGAWSDSGNFTSVQKAPDSSGRYSLWVSVCSRVASSAREAVTDVLALDEGGCRSLVADASGAPVLRDQGPERLCRGR
jgi:hypothetical protein